MLPKTYSLDQDVEGAGADWAALYWIAGVGTLIAVALMLIDIALSFAGGDVAVGGQNTAQWFAYLQTNGFIGLRNLGLFNVINLTLAIPLYLALYRLHSHHSPATAALAMIMILLGAAIYDANNGALSMLSLSNQYATATTEAQRSLLAAAGTTILAQAEDFTPGTFPGFFFSNLGSILMMVVMLRGKVFRKWVRLTGLVGSSSMLIFTICATFLPALFQTAMLLAILGGLLMVAWNLRMAFAMFGFGRAAARHSEKARIPTGRDTALNEAR